MSKYKSETEKFRELDFYKRYIKPGKRIFDIGCNRDKITKSAYGFDIVDTPDVDFLLNKNDPWATLPDQHKADIIYSSHCLEHIKDDRAALLRWCKSLKDDGFIVLYLPDENFYKEKNPDHVQHYTLSSFVEKLVKEFKFLELVECALDIRGECYSFAIALKKNMEYFK